MWEIEQLAKGLDYLMREVLSNKERQILEMFYGIDGEKFSQKEIAKIWRTSQKVIQVTKNRSIKKLKEYPDNRKIIEYFYDF